MQDKLLITIVNKLEKELKNFGEKPVEDAGAIINEVQQNHKIKESQVMGYTQRVYESLCVKLRKMDLRQARNSWVVASGNNFEDFIRNFVNEKLNELGILAIKGDRLKKSRTKAAKEIVAFLTLRARRRCVQQDTGVWPDSDIVLLTRDNNKRLRVFALINCKTSDHSRNTAVCFWALALRDLGIKYILATQDLDDRFVKGCDLASNLRRLSEAYLDRVYSTNPATTECNQIKKLDFRVKNGAKSFLDDILRWRDAIVPDADRSTIDLSFLKLD